MTPGPSETSSKRRRSTESDDEPWPPKRHRNISSRNQSAMRVSVLRSETRDSLNDDDSASDDSLMDNSKSTLEDVLANASTKRLFALCTELCHRRHRKILSKALKAACIDNSILEDWIINILTEKSVEPQRKRSPKVSTSGGRRSQVVEDGEGDDITIETKPQQHLVSRSVSTENGLQAIDVDNDDDVATEAIHKSLLARFAAPLSSPKRTSSEAARPAGAIEPDCSRYHALFDPWPEGKIGTCSYHPGKLIWANTLDKGESKWAEVKPSDLAVISKLPKSYIWTCCKRYADGNPCQNNVHSENPLPLDNEKAEDHQTSIPADRGPQETVIDNDSPLHDDLIGPVYLPPGDATYMKILDWDRRSKVPGLSNDPDRHQLDPSEVNLAAHLRCTCQTFLSYKTRLCSYLIVSHQRSRRIQTGPLEEFVCLGLSPTRAKAFRIAYEESGILSKAFYDATLRPRYLAHVTKGGPTVAAGVETRDVSEKVLTATQPAGSSHASQTPPLLNGPRSTITGRRPEPEANAGAAAEPIYNDSNDFGPSAKKSSPDDLGMMTGAIGANHPTLLEHYQHELAKLERKRASDPFITRLGPPRGPRTTNNSLAAMLQTPDRTSNSGYESEPVAQTASMRPPAAPMTAPASTSTTPTTKNTSLRFQPATVDGGSRFSKQPLQASTIPQTPPLYLKTPPKQSSPPEEGSSITVDTTERPGSSMGALPQKVFRVPTPQMTKLTTAGPYSSINQALSTPGARSHGAHETSENGLRGPQNPPFAGPFTPARSSVFTPANSTTFTRADTSINRVSDSFDPNRHPSYCDGDENRHRAARRAVDHFDVKYPPGSGCLKCRKREFTCYFVNSKAKCAYCISNNQSKEFCGTGWDPYPGELGKAVEWWKGWKGVGI